MTIKASDTNELLCDNDTVTTHHVDRSDFLRKLGSLDKIFRKKKTIHFISNKVFRDLKAYKAR